MEKYCCFNCPQSDYSEKSLTDLCPKCSLPYGFPLNEGSAPKEIDNYKVIKALSRGFYGATYIVEKKTSIRTKKMVFKVVPQKVYEFFGKNFEDECRFHAIAADGAQHIVDIDEIFDTEINFGDTIISCHVAILEYIEGDTLKSLLESSEPLKASTIGQIAIDLLKILSELHTKQLFHNDLHPGNIILQKLKDDYKRVGELDEYIKAVAIDFGSLRDKTQSGDNSNRVGDLHWVARTLNILSQKILENPYNSEERDYRLAGLLEERAHILFPRVTSQRIYEFDEVITQIKNAFIQVDSPWRQTLNLRNFKDSYNAQTMAPWFVPNLLVDDDDRWISEISNKGPQVITGMRGCGKTMLLRALQFHARAIPRDSSVEKNDSKLIVKRLQSEEYLGLYVSCTRLLDKLGEQDQPLHEPFTRLFLAYALEAINAIRHLRELDRTIINQNSFKIIAEAITSHVEGTVELSKLLLEHEIEKYIKNAINSLSKGEEKFTIKANPAIVFPQLANAFRMCSTIWQNSYIFFLLDDVSTRFLNDQNIIRLVSSLLFQNEFCSFKFTTEAQTLEMVINSPGNIEQARIGRDYNVFDLGYQVNEKVHSNKKDGIAFVEKILYKRANFHNSHPKNITPSQILGDASLQSIAENIAKPSKASEKKGLYHGITALAGVCVGDIGDIITLYEMILKKRNFETPVSPVNQNECYLELCNSRLFDIDRRESRLFDFAEAFAEAAHYLLIQSYKQSKKTSNIRLRQYSSIFINVSNGDTIKQYKQVRELIDAGIFNFSGGPQASRTNRQGVKPQQQFKLTYRKLYGINKHIGLAQSDRFELSGESLEEWLNNPKKGKDILIRNLKKGTDEIEVDGLADIDDSSKVELDKPYQMSFFDEDLFGDETDDQDEITTIENIAKDKTPNVSTITYSKLKKNGIYQIMVGLGFEECTLKSFENILQIAPQNATLIKFKEEGKSKEMVDRLSSLNVVMNTVEYSDVITGNLNLYSENTLFDITGLPQSIIFTSIRNSLINQENVNFAYTSAEIYYPLNEDIETLLLKHEAKDKTYFLESLSDILKGEQGPYKLIPLLPKEINPAARRVLVAFSSPKHERLFTLLDEREYDKILIIVPTEDGPRNKLARIAAEVVVRKFNHAEIKEFGGDSLQELMKYLSLQYQKYFINNNYSFEIAITGNKLQTVACAAICATYKVNQCWYLQPTEWDSKRFTQGYGDTQLYSINKVC
nr:AarF/UbiB family protein [uncultured Bacteroides sp.]